MKNSIFNAVCKTRYLALLVVLILTCGNAWGANIVIDLDLTKSATYPSGFPTSSGTTSGTYTFGGYSFGFSCNTAVYRGSTGSGSTLKYYILIGKAGATENTASIITFPAIADYKLTEVKLTVASTSGENVAASIRSNWATILSGGTSWTFDAGQSNTWTLSSTAANTAYKMYIIRSSGSNTYNGQLAGLKLTYEPASASCADPSAPEKGSVTSTGATISEGTSGNYNIYYSTNSSTPSSSTSALATISSGTSVDITGLKYGTTYYYWAQKDCGVGSVSNYVAGSPTSFTTSCPNSLSVSAGTLTTSGATFTITDNNSPTYISFNGSGYGYEIYYSTSNDTPGSSPSGTVTTTSTSKSVTGLSAGQKYYYWVRGYGPNGKSSWVSGGNFTTLDLSSIAITTDPTKLAYIHGETFDKTGAVVTATYTNSTTANVSSSAVWTPSTALTTTGSNTITASYTENGTEKTTTIDVTVYGVTMQALDDGGNAIPASGPDAPTRSVATITPKADKGQYVWKEWSVSGASLGSSKETKSNSINTPTADITVTAVYWAPRNVVWMVNGAAYTTGSPTSTIAYNKEWKDLKLPTDPEDPPCGDKFMGWTTTNIGSTGLDVDDDASEIADLDLMTSGNKSEKTGATGHYITDATVTFYAVFADYGEEGE